MDTGQINNFVQLKQSRAFRSSFIPQLTIGTQPTEQGSVVATISPTSSNLVASNSVPYVSGGYPHYLAPLSNPGVQNQRWLPSAQPSPWTQIPACRLGVPPPKARPLGLTPDSSANLNFPNTPKSVLTLRTF